MRQILVIILGGIASIISLGIIVVNFDPFQAAGYIKFLFFTSVFATILSIGTVGSFYLVNRGDDRFEKSCRFGFLISVSILIIFWGVRLISSLN